MLLGPNMMRSQGLPPLLNSSSVFGTKASSGMTSTSSLIPSLSYRSFSTSDSEYFTYSAFTTARIVVPSYGRAPWAGTRARQDAGGHDGDQHERDTNEHELLHERVSFGACSIPGTVSRPIKMGQMLGADE